MPVSKAAIQSEREYRKWLTRFSMSLLAIAAMGVLGLSAVWLRDIVPWGTLLALVASALAVAALIGLVPWHRVHPGWFLFPQSLVLAITLWLLAISGGYASPFRLLLVGILLFAVAHFQRGWLWLGCSTVMTGFFLIAWWRRPLAGAAVIETACLVLLAVIGARTIHALRTQRHKILELNERVQLQRAQAIEATRTRTVVELAGGVAHELNQPLTVLLAESERLARAPGLAAEMKEPIESCFAAAQQAARIVEQLQRLTAPPTTPYVAGVAISDVSTPPAAA